MRMIKTLTTGEMKRKIKILTMTSDKMMTSDNMMTSEAMMSEMVTTHKLVTSQRMTSHRTIMRIVMGCLRIVHHVLHHVMKVHRRW
jgi:hypothetical protein